jgi:hypothetical protein
MRFRPKQENISTDHFPSPLTAISFSSTSSSLALISISVESSPLANFCASPWIYSAFRPESPAVRRVAKSHAATCEGVGKHLDRSSSLSAATLLPKRSMNFLLMDFAAAPDTLRFVRLCMYRFLGVHTCWDMMLLDRVTKGSISSASPSRENIGHWCLSMTCLSVGSTLMRWAQASSRIFSVVLIDSGAAAFLPDGTSPSA